MYSYFWCKANKIIHFSAATVILRQGRQGLAKSRIGRAPARGRSGAENIQQRTCTNFGSPVPIEYGKTLLTNKLSFFNVYLCSGAGKWARSARCPGGGAGQYRRYAFRCVGRRQ